MFLTLTPVFGAAGGMLVLGERLATPQLVGAVRIVGAMAALLAGQGRASAPPRE